MKKLHLDFFLISGQQSVFMYCFENYLSWCFNLFSTSQGGGLMHVDLLTSTECIIHYDRTTTSSMVSNGTTGKARDTLSKPQLWWFDQQISKCFCIIMWIMYCIAFKDFICQAYKHTSATCLIFKHRKHALVFWRDQFSTISELQ